MDATAGVLPILRLVAVEEAVLLVDLIGEAWQLVEEVHNSLVLLLDNLKLGPDQRDLLLHPKKHPRKEFHKAFRLHGPLAWNK